MPAARADCSSGAPTRTAARIFSRFSGVRLVGWPPGFRSDGGEGGSVGVDDRLERERFPPLAGVGDEVGGRRDISALPARLAEVLPDRAVRGGRSGADPHAMPDPAIRCVESLVQSHVTLDADPN